MNESTKFINEVLDDPFKNLGINTRASLDLAVDYLVRSHDREDQPLLEKVVKILFYEFDNEHHKQFNSSDDSFEMISRLLMNSFWGDETLLILTKQYLYEPAKNNDFHDVFMEYLLVKLERRSRYLITENFGYFEEMFLNNPIESYSEVEQAIYCMHALNAYFLYFGNKLELSAQEFLQITRENLWKISSHQQTKLRRLAIWALYWCDNGTDDKSGLLKLNKQEADVLSNGTINNPDQMTNGRITCMLIKNNHKLLKTVIAARNAIDGWEFDINKKVDLFAISHVKTPYHAIIETVCLDILSLTERKIWLEKMVIPYLTLFASKNTIRKLFSYLLTNGMQQEAAFIILGSLGHLQSNQVNEEVYANFPKIIDRIISRKGDLIHKLKAKDTTGRWAYYFVLVPASREAAFLHSIEGDGTIDLEHYGKVVASCYGESPTQEVKDYLKEKYRFEV
ncbi:hypothetical protein [Mucilaginibacter dorajii]|uniref:Uncharacterized protein n=2 Tax=Mucilaginibacter dorajii TaxID=692994 RepID=A0ABP7Q6T5_9SPHI